MNELLSRYFCYPTWEFFSSRNVFRFYGALKELEKSQWLSRNQLIELKNKKLRKLIEHSYTNVPYYHNLFKNLKLKPNDIKEEKDLHKIPVLTKDIIRKNLKNLMASNYTAAIYWLDHTGGSTGKVLDFYRDRTTHEFTLAVNRRFGRWAGYGIGTKMFRIWGSPYDISLYDNFRTKMHNYLINDVLVNSFDMSISDMQNYAGKFKKFNPKIVHGYANSVYLFAKYLQENKIDFKKPKAVITTSEKLYPFQRKLIEETFDCKLFEEYGCREMELIAHECEAHDGLHLASEKFIFEVLDNKNNTIQNKNGYVVLTDLNNFAMPFIRYKNEDVGSKLNENCSCGRSLEKLGFIEGRSTDFIIGEKGKIVSGVAITTYMARISGIEEFRIVQDKRDKIEVYVVKSEEYNSTTHDNIINFLKKYIGDIGINIKYVSNIPLTASGKRRTIINKLKINF